MRNIRENSSNEIVDFFSEIVTEYNLQNAKCILLSTDFELDALYLQLISGIDNFSENVVLVRNAKRAINQVTFLINHI